MQKDTTRVKCKVCKNESARLCSVNKCGIHPNKKRMCASFVFEPSKVVIHTTAPATQLRPDWYWDKKLRRMARKASSVLLAQQTAAMEGVTTQGPDCLAGIRSTAS